MTNPAFALIDYLGKTGVDLNGDSLRGSVQMLTQMLFELEVEQQIGAGKHERSPDGDMRRNRCRERICEIRVRENPTNDSSLASSATRSALRSTSTTSRATRADTSWQTCSLPASTRPDEPAR